jgi:FAD/FMN-containing dehydrogenase
MPDRQSLLPAANFGANIPLAPRHFYAPRNEEELLKIMGRHAEGRLRAVGRWHSWNPALVGDDVFIDMRHFQEVVVHAEGDSPWAEVGAGCQIHRLLAELRRQGGYTLLSQGLIQQQALAGAAATGTHGSGKHSLSHYVHAARIARYSDATGKPCIEEIDRGAELAAARCGLGCLGVLTSLRIPVCRAYFVEEHFRRYPTLDEVLAQEAEYPLQQFYLVPWRWNFYAQHRREVDAPRSRSAPLYRLFWSVGMDTCFHWGVIALARGLPPAATRVFYRWVMPALLPLGWKVVDRSDRQLSMAHEKFRHIETELFVARSQLPAALDFVTRLLRHVAGETVTLAPEETRALDEHGLAGAWRAARGCHQQRYPICIRKVLPDDTLISMSCGDEPRYAISIISYVTPARRAGFFRCADLLVATLARLFGGRPHWGKYGALDREVLETLYPRLEEFRALVQRHDPAGRFRTPALDQLFGPEPSGPAPRADDA